MERKGSYESAELPGLTKREKRYRKLIRVQVEAESGARFAAVVTNLSKRGMGGRTAGLLKEGDRVAIIQDELGRVGAEVRWVDGERFGLAFVDPIYIEQFNFLGKNDKGHFVKPIKNGHVWKGFDINSSTRRPGVTSQFSKEALKRN